MTTERNMLELAEGIEYVIENGLSMDTASYLRKAEKALRRAAQAAAVPAGPMREAVEALIKRLEQYEIRLLMGDQHDRDIANDIGRACHFLAALTNPAPDAQRNEPDVSAIELIQVPRVALEWLFGAAPGHDGLWFGESVTEVTKKYGWRSRFREICATLGFPLPADQQKQEG